ncbi:16716_t:CDS:10, partial [Acaulospora morrowiae]
MKPESFRHDKIISKRYSGHGKCAQCKRYNTAKVWCQSCDPFKTIKGWTSGNNDIDDFIKEFQFKATKYEDVIEWIPFNKLSEFRSISEKEFRAHWLDGIRKIKRNKQSRTLSCSVELKKFDDLQVGALEFIRNDSENKIYGITQHTTGEYMIVFDKFSSIRDNINGKCVRCKRYNTSEAWCQSCDPFKTTQGWTSENNDIDDCIKEFQFKTTKYEDVIEWIPFDRLSEFQNINKKEFRAHWLDGIRKVKINTQSRTLSYSVELKKFDDLQVEALEFIRNFKDSIQSKDSKQKVFGITQDTTGEYMIVFDDFYFMRYEIFGECAQCKRYNTSEAWCLSCDPFKVTQGWTSENNDIDDYIKECQLKAIKYEDAIEWIPFNRLSEFRKIGKIEFRAQWLDGIRKVTNNTQSRTSSCSVELKKLDGLQVDALEFIRNLRNYIQSENKVYGVTQDTTGQYMVVFDSFYFRRSRAHGKCAQCERYNTSKAWCQSCNPFKTIQGWTSGNNDLDNCIKEFQLKATDYENVIEWVPFNRLSEFRNISKTKFQALWLDGIRKVKNNTQSRTLSCSVELKKLDGLQVDALEFIRNFKNYIQSEDKVYGITQDTTGQYMIVFDAFYSRRSRAQCEISAHGECAQYEGRAHGECAQCESRAYGECAQCERYNTSKAWCQSCDPFKTTQGWTSENNNIDNFIKELQLKATDHENIIEWIPFNRLSEFRNIGETGFKVLWLDGIRKIKNNTQSRTLSCSVELKKFDGLQVDALEFIRNFKNRILSEDSKHKIYGITRDTTGQYMIVCDDFYSIRYNIYGECAQCERYNTSEAWCQSCDTFKTTQGWTSGNNDIDNCIKEFQLKTIKYENVIEWIPFNRLSNLQKVDESRFQALWLDGIRKVKNNTQSRTLCSVELKKFDGLQVDALEFIRNDSKREVYGITQDTTTSQYMIVHDYPDYIVNREYENCARCGSYNTSLIWCQLCDPFKVTQGWTSGNNEIDDCIKEFQLKATEYENIIEWIPFDKLSNLQKIGESKFQALWSDGIRNVKDNKQSRIFPYVVELRTFGRSQLNTTEFIEKFKNHMQLKDNKHKMHGITQDKTTGQYMIAFDDFHYIRNKLYGKCAQCNRYNTSFFWCQSCDPFKITKGWTSGNSDIDDCIKEFQLNATRHEDVIEWIPFNRLINLRKIGETRLIAIWLDGIRKVENNAQSRSSSHIVELKSSDNPQINALDFIGKFKNQNKEHKVYGVTQDTSTQYMVVVNFNSVGNKKFGTCRWGEHYNTSRAWCQLCDPFRITQGWTSENINIDNCIKEFQSIATEYDEVIEWIPFSRLSNIQEIGKGGFGCVYSAIWLDGKRKIINNGKEFIQSRTQPYTVALKTLPCSPTSTAEFLREFKNHMQCRLMGSSLEVYGLTKNTTTNECMMVLQYANNEITIGMPPFDDYIFKGDLALEILDGLRPNFAPGTPDFYVDFAKLCMNSDPQERPTAKVIFQKLEKWYGFIEELDEIEIDEDNINVVELDELDEPEKIEISNKFWESDEIAKQLPVTMQKHQDDAYTSQFIDTDDISQRYKLRKNNNISQRHYESVNIST